MELESRSDYPGTSAPAKSVLIIACGALAREILAIKQANGLDHVTLTCLRASLHATPEQIPDAVRQAIRKHRDQYDTILIGFGDCGTGGLLDKVLAEEGAERIEGAHCYAFFTGVDEFSAAEEDDLGTFYLTDFLARQFDAMVYRPLGLDRYPELRDMYFAHYTRVVYLAQFRDAQLEKKAAAAADKLGLPLEIRYTGYGDLATFVGSA
ncbi:MAG: DUF1638 domain-containing protein [Stappiaceae bacterium]